MGSQPMDLGLQMTTKISLMNTLGLHHINVKLPEMFELHKPVLTLLFRIVTKFQKLKLLVVHSVIIILLLQVLHFKILNL